MINLTTFKLMYGDKSINRNVITFRYVCQRLGCKINIFPTQSDIFLKIHKSTNILNKPYLMKYSY